MDRAAIGVRMHSGWGALVAVSISPGQVEILDRRHLTVIAPETKGAKQPYHFAEGLEFSQAEEFIHRCFAASLKLASTGLHQAAEELRKRQYRVTGTAVLRASGRPLPPLANILASRALIHAAEGEFFRDIIFKACENLDLAVTGIRERDLEDHLQKNSAAQQRECTSRFQKQDARWGLPGHKTKKPQPWLHWPCWEIVPEFTLAESY